MDKMKSYLVFSKVAEFLSFSRAAEALNLPRATISTTIQDLEIRLRVQLLNRTTRRVSLTLEGSLFLERCLRVLADVENLELFFKNSDSKLNGCIRVDMPVNFAREIVLPRLNEFRTAYPEIRIELSSIDSFIDVVREGVDLVIRSGSHSDNNFIVKKLMDVSFGNYVSPIYAEKYGLPSKLSELDNHFMVSYSQKIALQEQGFKYLSNGKLKTKSVTSAINVNSTVSYTDACIEGIGIAQLPRQSVLRYVSKGELTEVLPNYTLPDTTVDILHLRTKKVSKRLLVFISWLEEIAYELNQSLV